MVNLSITFLKILIVIFTIYFFSTLFMTDWSYTESNKFPWRDLFGAVVNLFMLILLSVDLIRKTQSKN